MSNTYREIKSKKYNIRAKLSTHKSIKSQIHIESKHIIKIKQEKWHHVQHVSKQTNKKKQTNRENELKKKFKSISCPVRAQDSMKEFMKLLAQSAKKLETLKGLPNIIFDMHIMELRLLLHFCSFLKNWLTSVTKA